MKEILFYLLLLFIPLSIFKSLNSGKYMTSLIYYFVTIASVSAIFALNSLYILTILNLAVFSMIIGIVLTINPFYREVADKDQGKNLFGKFVAFFVTAGFFLAFTKVIFTLPEKNRASIQAENSLIIGESSLLLIFLVTLTSLVALMSIFHFTRNHNG